MVKQLTGQDKQHIFTDAKRKILNLMEEIENSPPLSEDVAKENRQLKIRTWRLVNHLRLALFEIEEFERELDLI